MRKILTTTCSSMNSQSLKLRPNVKFDCDTRNCKPVILLEALLNVPSIELDDAVLYCSTQKKLKQISFKIKIKRTIFVISHESDVVRVIFIEI